MAEILKNLRHSAFCLLDNYVTIPIKKTSVWLSIISPLMLAVCLLLPSTVTATLLTVNNFSFENPSTAAATFTGDQASGPADWSVYNTGDTNGFRYFGVWNPATTDSYFDPVPDGSNVGVVFLLNTFNIAEAGLQQVLSSTLQVSTRYTLTVDVGNFNPNVSSPWDFTGFPGYRVDLLAGGVLLASDNNTLTPDEGRFEKSTVSYTVGASHANAGQALAIRLVNLNGTGVEVNFDDVKLDATAVPEPSSTGLVIFGLVFLVLGIYLRRQESV
ncbi:MAG: PEP-CTERM sorting domain-containing protein [Methylococcales bacterium]|nr:PEP-CTERM sorting domain-containing protein [Methylococcales bacterium]